VQLKRAERQYRLTTGDYAKLAGFRHALRGFLHFSEEAAAAAGLTAQHYHAMLVLRGWPEGAHATIADLAQQLLIKHNSAVGLVDRLAQESLVVRVVSSTDRRKVELRLTARGRQVLATLAAMHRTELQRIGPMMRRFFAEISRLAAKDAVGPRVRPDDEGSQVPRRLRRGARTAGETTPTGAASRPAARRR